MTKKEFIQLIIRFAGIILLITSFDLIIKGITTAIAIFLMLPVSMPTEYLSILSLAEHLFHSIFIIGLVIYLLLGGKWIKNIIHRTSALKLENSLQRENYSEILIRCFAIWWIWKIVHQLYRLIIGSLYALLLSHPEWLWNHLDGSEESVAKLQEILAPIQDHLYWFVLSNIILYALLAWYFLKGGKLFINLLNRCWLGKKENTIQSES